MIKSSYEIMRAMGIPVRIHLTLVVLLAMVLLNRTGQDFVYVLLLALGIMGSILLHELGHSVLAMQYGSRVKSILLLPIGGMAQLDRLPEKPAEEFAVAAIGPMVSALLGAGLWFVPSIPGLGPGTLAGSLAAQLGAINLFLAVFNLIPSFPMDGGRIFRAWMTPRVGRLEATRRAARIGKTLALAFGLYSLIYFNLLNLALAIFVFVAADLEYRQVLFQETMKNSPFRFFFSGGNPFGAAPAPPPPPGPDPDRPGADRDGIEVSPPPYRR